jgi:3-hydroxybutyryl-CoA dehydratase
MTQSFEALQIGETVRGIPFSPTQETIREFCEASLDYNPLHWDADYTKGAFGKTNFGGVIMHGMTNFGVLTKMLTDWLYPVGGVHRRLETRWKAPVKPGDTIFPIATVSAKKKTGKSCWAILTVEIKNQHGHTIALGEALAEFPAVT